LSGHDWPAAPADGRWQIDGDSARLTVQVRGGRIARLRYVCDTSS